MSFLETIGYVAIFIFVPVMIEKIYSWIVYLKRSKIRMQAEIELKDLYNQISRARGSGVSVMDSEVLQKVEDGNRIDLYSNEAVSVLGVNTANDLREIKERMRKIDNNTADIRNWNIYNPYKK